MQSTHEEGRLTLGISTIRAAGYRLRIATSQRDRNSTPLFLFNGLGANLELLFPFAEEMEKYGTWIVTFDVPGIGGSDPPVAPYRLSGLARVANEVLIQLGISGEVDLLGVSWGGGFAQAFTHRYAQRVRRLVLAATTAGAVALPGRFSALVSLLSARRYEGGHMVHVGGELYGGKVRRDPELLEQYGKLLRPPKGIGYRYQLLSGAGWTSVHWLHEIKQPTLVMMGTEDPLVPVANGRLLASLLPNARLVTLRDGHVFLLTSAPESAAIVHDFLAEND